MSAAKCLYRSLMMNDLEFSKDEVENMKYEKINLEKRKDKTRKEKEIIYVRYEKKEDAIKIKRKLAEVDQVPHLPGHLTPNF